MRITWLTSFVLASLAFLTVAAQPAAQPHKLTTLQVAADRIEIMELGAQFDNALDSENRQRFIAAFVPDGVLEGFWGQAKGPEQIGKAFDFMLSTFAKNRRHVVSNHEIEIYGDTAHMFSYLVVFDRATNSSIGTATFTDAVVKRNGHWLFQRRRLKADPNVDAIVKSLAHPAEPQGAQ